MAFKIFKKTASKNDRGSNSKNNQARKCPKCGSQLDLKRT